MELMTIIIMSIIILVVLIILLGINLKKLMSIKKMGENTELREITNKLPEDEQICKEILTLIKNENVKINANKNDGQTCLYFIANNSIFIGNLKKSFTRVQTIAHECIHSVQDKRLLWFNFILSNVYLVFFYITIILNLFNKLPMPNIFTIILVMMSILLYFVRSYLETDAMIKARFLAKEYMEKKNELIDKNGIDLVIDNYDKMNEFGIKLYNFNLLFKYLLKVIVYCFVGLI